MQTELKITYIDRDPSNNTKENLRIVSMSQNMFNTGLYAHNTSGIKGVHLFKRTGRWSAHIKIAGKKIHLGYFTTKAEAAYAREKAEHSYLTGQEIKNVRACVDCT